MRSARFMLLCLLIGCDASPVGIAGQHNGDGDSQRTGGDSAGDRGDAGRGDVDGSDAFTGDPTGDTSGGDPASGDPGPRFTCSSCHGSASNAAPPLGLGAETHTSDTGVGAHQSHLGPSDWHAPVQCSDCHRVPATLDAAGHIDTPLPAELVFSRLAVVRGVTPVWNGATCANTYCHGAPLMTGGSNLEPQWTDLEGLQASCGTCHGLPPGDTHPASTDCQTCHGEVVDGPGSFVAPERHIDGVVDVTHCDGCHGNPPAPATESYPGGGGAHASHMAQPSIACRTCHGHNGSGPTHAEGGATVLQTHVDLVFDPVTFPGGTTMENLATPSETYNSGNPTCEVGCHNPVPGDVPDLANSAVWTDASISCVDCHERPGTEPPFNHNLDPDAQGDATLRASCSTCHDLTQHMGGSLLFLDPDPDDTFSWTAGGASGLCRTCHDGSAGPYFVSGTPQDESDFWTVPSAHEAAGIDCSHCHGAHGDASGRVLVEAEEGLCLSCHDGSGSSTDIAGELLKGSTGADLHRHPVVDAEQSGGREVECTSCHDPHRAVATNVLAGMAGIDLDGNPVDPAVRDASEQELCFVCHGDAFNSARPRTTNKRLDFNPSNSSFHPVAGPGRNTSTAMANSLRGGLTVESTIACSDCHNNEQTADVAGPVSASTAVPQGPHGSSEPFILRAAYWSNPVGPSSWDSGNYELCFLCHDVSAFSTESAVNATNFADGNENLHFEHVRGATEDNVTCANCHYNSHSTENASTRYNIDGTTTTGPPDGAKTRGVSFSPDIYGTGGNSIPLFWMSTSTRERACLLTCHGRTHGYGMSYTPSSSRDDDSLTY